MIWEVHYITEFLNDTYTVGLATLYASIKVDDNHQEHWTFIIHSPQRSPLSESNLVPHLSIKNIIFVSFLGQPCLG